MEGLGFRVWKVWGVGFMEGLGFRVHGRFRV